MHPSRSFDGPSSSTSPYQYQHGAIQYQPPQQPQHQQQQYSGEMPSPTASSSVASADFATYSQGYQLPPPLRNAYRLPHPAHRSPSALPSLGPQSGLLASQPGPSGSPLTGSPSLPDYSKPASPPPPPTTSKRPKKRVKSNNASAVAVDGIDSAHTSPAPGDDRDEDDTKRTGKHGPRVAKACLPCSSKKRRCDGGQPECKVCSVLGTPCSYNTSGLKRGPPKGFRSTPKESAKARLLRTLETTIRDLTAHLGKEEAGQELIRVSGERGVELRQTGGGSGEDEKDDKDTAGRPVSEERDGDFLGINEKGEVQHRGSSSGIQLLHRRHTSGVSGSSQHSPLAAHASPKSSSSTESRERAPSASGLASGSVLPLPLVRSSSHSHSSGAGAVSPAVSQSPEVERASFNMHSVSLSNGAQAHREHILNTLSPHGTPRSNARNLSDAASAGRWSSPLKSGNVSLPPISPVPAESETESAQLRTTLQTVRRQSLTYADAGLGTDPPVSEKANARLWKCYFSGVHPAWPLLYKPALDEIPVSELPDRLDRVLLYAVYALASCVSGPVKAGSPLTRTTALDPALDEELGESVGEIFARRSEQYFYASRLRPCVSAIQAAFLLALYFHGQGELSKAWTWCGLAQQLTMDLGFHRWPIHRIDLLTLPVERETRVRLIHHVRILGTLLSAEMGRPVIMRAKDCDVPLLSEKEADEFDVWDDLEVPPEGEAQDDKSAVGKKPRYVHAPSTLNEGVRLFNIIEMILTSVHSFRRKAALRKQGNAKHVLAEIDAELTKWKEELPEHLQFHDKPAKEEALPSFFALNVWYYTGILLLHRPFIPQDEGVALADVLANDSHRKCTQAATTLCDMLQPIAADVDRLTTDLAYCLFSASVMFLFNAGLAHKEIATDAKKRFSLCREWLKKLSARWPAASAHKQLLDGVASVAEDVMAAEDENGEPRPRTAGARTSQQTLSGGLQQQQQQQQAQWEAPNSNIKSWMLSNERGGLGDVPPPTGYPVSAHGGSNASSPPIAFRQRMVSVENGPGAMGPPTSRPSQSPMTHAQALASPTQAHPQQVQQSQNQVAQQVVQQQLQQLQQMQQNQQQQPQYLPTAEQERQLMEYLSNSTSQSYYNQAPSIFDAESVFWNETAGRRADAGGVGIIGVPTGVPRYPQSAPLGATGYGSPNGANGLAMLAQVTAGSSSGQQQQMPTSQSPSQTSMAPPVSSAQQFYQQHPAFPSPLPMPYAQASPRTFDQSGNDANAGVPARQGSITASPFAFSLDPAQPRWEDVMQLLQLPPAYS